MDKIYLLFSATPRSGNTFLSRCLSTAIELNPKSIDMRVSSHLHSPAILAFDQTDEVKTYTLFRNPEDTVISSTIHKIFFQKGPDYSFTGDMSSVYYNINRAVNEYMEFLEFQNKHNKATVIMFDKLKSDPNSVIKQIFDDCNAAYVNEISADNIMQGIQNEDKKLYTSGTGDFSKAPYHTPHNIEKNPIYDRLKKELPYITIYQNLKSLYDEMVKKYG
jgi:hypothetical protein